MNSKIRSVHSIRSASKLFPMTAAIVATTISIGIGTSAAYALPVRPGAPNSQPAKVATPQAPVSLTMKELNTRVAKLPEFAALKDGSVVTISDDGSETGTAWQGTFVFHPAGSQVQLSDMPVRWKDGLVKIGPNMTDGAVDTTNPFQATLVQQTYALEIRGDVINDPGIAEPVSESQVVEPLIPEPTDASVLRIPNNAWLFRSAGNGQYTTLVDAFTYQSGSLPLAVDAGVN